MQTNWKIVFRGDILSGFDLEQVKKEFSASLKLSDEKASRLFSGNKVTLKKGLDKIKAEMYKNSFAKKGISVYLEQDIPKPTESTLFVGLSLEPIVESPKQEPENKIYDNPYTKGTGLKLDESYSSEKQEERYTSQSSQHNNTDFSGSSQSSQRDAGFSSSGQYQNNSESGFNQNYYDAPESMEFAYPSSAEVSAPDIFSFDFDGRFGRLNYVNSNVALLGAIIGAGIISALIPFLYLFLLLGLIPVIVLLMRYSILRLHDLNLTGWLVLLILIPIVGNVMNLLLMFMPGNKGSNNYGPPPEQGNIAGLFIYAIFVLVLLVQLFG